MLACSLRMCAQRPPATLRFRDRTCREAVGMHIPQCPQCGAVLLDHHLSLDRPQRTVHYRALENGTHETAHTALAITADYR